MGASFCSSKKNGSNLNSSVDTGVYCLDNSGDVRYSVLWSKLQRFINICFGFSAIVGVQNGREGPVITRL